MRRRGRCTFWCLALAACLFFGSCGRHAASGTGSPSGDEAGEQDIPPTKHHPVDELRIKIGRELIPQDAGRLSLSCPQDWEQSFDRSSVLEGYLLGLHHKGGTVEELPRILIAAEDSPYPELLQVNEATLVDFVKAVMYRLKDKTLETPVTPIMAGQTACAAYVEMVKRKSGRGPRLVVTTLAGGRLYTINLDVPEPQFAKYRDAAYAVAASLKAVGQAGSPPAEQPPTAPPPAAEKQPADPPTEPTSK